MTVPEIVHSMSAICAIAFILILSGGVKKHLRSMMFR